VSKIQFKLVVIYQLHNRLKLPYWFSCTYLVCPGKACKISEIDPLRTKRNVLCLKTQILPRIKHSPSKIIKTNQLNLGRSKSLFVLRSIQNA
jgi:hypothetical protein